MSIPELLTVTPAVTQLILNMSDSAAIEEQARKEGYKSMKEWGNEMIERKITTKMEVERAIG